MTKAKRHNKTCQFGVILIPLLFLPCPLTVVGQLEQKHDRAEDAFVAQHREAERKNPDGVSFTLRIEENKVQFKPGEIIRVEFSFTSDLSDSYDLNGATYDRGGRLQLDKYFLDHKKGVVDPLSDYLPGRGGGIRSNPTLSEKPHTMTFDLNEWFRFDQPSKFRLYVTAPRVLKKAERNFGNGAEVTSNIVEFEILPRDHEWADQELQSIIRLLDSSDPNADRRPVCRRLRFLNTEAAASEMILRFGGPLDVCGFEYSMGLIGSAHRAFVVKEMERRLEAPDQVVSGGYLHTLSHIAASLRRKEELPSPAERPNDEGQAKAAAEAWRGLGDSRQELQVKYTERLISALPRKHGKARAITTHTLLEMLWNENLQRGQKRLIDIAEAGRPGSARGYQPEIIQRLAPEIIAVFDDLPVNVQMGLLGHRWRQLSDPAMLPVIRRILNNKPANDRSYESRELRALAIRRLYELAADEGRRLIIEEMRRPDPSVGFATLRILPDETLPQLEETLVENLEKSLSGESGSVDIFSSLIERYATASVLPRVRAFYGDKVGQRGCSYQSTLLAYFLRVDPAMGIDLIKQAIAGRGPGSPQCYDSALPGVAKLRTHPELEAMAIDRLDDPDPKIVAGAASMLGQYGSPDAEGPLWRRLDKWLQDWKGRVEELMKDYKHDHPNIWHREAGHALRSALFNSPAWLPDREKLEKLRQAYFSKEQLKEFNRLAGELTDNIQITFSTGDGGWGNARVAHYECNSLPVLEEKLKQFPAGVTFLWKSYGHDPATAEQVFSELKTFLEGKGMKMEKRKNQ